MGATRRRLFVLGALTGGLAIAAFLGGAGTVGASPDSACGGKPICVEVQAQGTASYSTTSNVRYLADTVTLYHGDGNSTLTNVTWTLSWADTEIPGTPSSSFVKSIPDGCVGSNGTLSCPVPSTLAPGAPSISYQLVFSTALDDSGATATTVTAQASAKEQTTPKNGKTAVTAPVTGTTTYESDPFTDISVYGGGLSATLATTRGNTTYALPLAADKSQGLATLDEAAGCDDATVGGTTYTCFGQGVTVTASGLTPVHLHIEFTGSLPSGANENNIVVLHTRTGPPAQTVVISTPCTAGDPPTNYSPNGCLTVSLTRLPMGQATVVIDAWDISNGGWGAGIS